MIYLAGVCCCLLAFFLLYTVVAYLIFAELLKLYHRAEIRVHYVVLCRYASFIPDHLLVYVKDSLLHGCEAMQPRGHQGC